MNDNEITPEEIDSHKKAMIILEDKIQTDSRALEELKKNPAKFFDSIENAFYDYIKKSKDLLAYFVAAIKRIMKFVTRLINKCVGCKISALTVMLGTMGKFGIALEAFTESAAALINWVEKVLGETGEDAESMLDFLRRTLKSIEPSTVAMQICRQLGMCQPLDLRPAMITDGPGRTMTNQ